MKASRASSTCLAPCSLHNFFIYFVLLPFPGGLMTVLNVWVFIVIALNSWNCARACAWMKTQNKATLSNFQVLSTNSIVHLQQAVSEVRKSTCRGYNEHREHVENVFKVTCSMSDILYCFSAEMQDMIMDI